MACNLPTSISLVRIGNRSFPFTSFENVSASYRATIDALGIGASETPLCDIVDSDGNIIGYVSYNGRVWNSRREDWKAGDKPVFDPCQAA